MIRAAEMLDHFTGMPNPYHCFPSVGADQYVVFPSSEETTVGFLNVVSYQTGLLDGIAFCLDINHILYIVITPVSQ